MLSRMQAPLHRAALARGALPQAALTLPSRSRVSLPSWPAWAKWGKTKSPQEPAAAPLPAKEPVLERGFNLFVRFMKTKLWLSVLGGAATLAMLGGAYYVWGAPAQKAATLRALEAGAVGGHNLPDDAAATVQRPDVHAVLLQALRPGSAQKYLLICGEHGTGKSTAVLKAARDPSVSAVGGTGESTKVGTATRAPRTDGVNGVVYYLVSSADTFIGGLAATLGMPTVLIDLERSFASVFNKTNQNEKVVGLPELETALADAAKEFRAKHKRPATLVLDNVDVLARKKPELLADLQQFAKGAADAQDLLVVFGTSAGAAPAQLKGSSLWSRAQKPPLEIGDITDEQAVTYLTSRGVVADVAKLLVDQITGGRFALLTDYVPPKEAPANVAEAAAESADKQDDLPGILKEIGIPDDHPFFKKLLETERVKSSLAVDLGMDKKLLAALLKNNIIASHLGASTSYSFHSRYVQRFMQRKNTQQSSTKAA